VTLLILAFTISKSSVTIKNKWSKILTKGRITILSPLVAMNGFVRPWPYLISAHGAERLIHWAPRAVECDSFSGRGSRLSPDASAYQRIISNNSYAHDEQGSGPSCNTWFLGPNRVSSPNGISNGSAVLQGSEMSPSNIMTTLLRL